MPGSNLANNQASSAGVQQELSSEDRECIEQEESILSEVLESLRTQVEKRQGRVETESARARDLTSKLVAATRDEDKAMLASDEAVSHALRDNGLEELKSLERLLNKPYFARFQVKELENGRSKTNEYRLGFAANPDCRIVDWRKAPISKLYYEYREGDDFFEIIQGREREGTIELRNSLEIEKQQLLAFRCRRGAFKKSSGNWIKTSNIAAAAGSAGELPHILSLITAEQFQTITEEANTAILIQGVAGSGKTTVALHRLAWMLHEDNSNLKAEECVFVVHSQALRNYVRHVLPSMGIEGVKICTFEEWAALLVKSMYPNCFDDSGKLLHSELPTPAGVSRVKFSIGVLLEFEKQVREKPELHDYFDLMLATLSNTAAVLEKDDSKLLDRDLLREAWSFVSKQKLSKSLDVFDLPLCVRLLELRRPAGSPAFFGHVAVDEVQDLSVTQMAALVESVKEPRHMTLVGDTAQQIRGNAANFAWEKLRRNWDFKEDVSRFISLSISHRSTLPIMKLADHVQDRQTVTDGRKGRVPIWFKCHTESRAIESVIAWLEKALERYPNAMTAVICADPAEAKHALSLLRPSFHEALRPGDEHSFSFEEGIVVTCASQVKGLEFTNVLLWNPSARTYQATPLHRNLLYVAITRAAENLCLVTWSKPSPLLPSPHSRLIRLVEEELEDPALGES